MLLLPSLVLPTLAGLGASTGWAAGSLLAQSPASRLGTFEFTRIQLIACSAILAALCSIWGLWSTIDWSHWSAFVSSTLIGIFLGNLAMIECLRQGGARRTELLLSLKAPLVAGMALLWFGETLSAVDLLGAGLSLTGVVIAILAGGDAPAAPNTARGPLLWVIALGLTATGCMGYGFLVLKPALDAGLAPLAASALRLLGAAFVVSLIALWPTPQLRAKAPLTPKLLGQTILPGVIGYVISSSLLLYAFAYLPAGIAVVLASLSPVLILPMLWLKEAQRPRGSAVFGAVLTVIGTGILVLL